MHKSFPRRRPKEGTAGSRNRHPSESHTISTKVDLSIRSNFGSSQILRVKSNHSISPSVPFGVCLMVDGVVLPGLGKIGAARWDENWFCYAASPVKKSAFARSTGIDVKSSMHRTHAARKSAQIPLAGTSSTPKLTAGKVLSNAEKHCKALNNSMPDLGIGVTSNVPSRRRNHPGHRSRLQGCVREPPKIAAVCFPNR